MNSTRIELEDGAGEVGVSDVVPREPRGVALTVFDPTVPDERGSTVILSPLEGRRLVVELLRRLKGGDSVARLPVAALSASPSARGDVAALALDRLVDLVCGETVPPARIREKNLPKPAGGP